MMPHPVELMWAQAVRHKDRVFAIEASTGVEVSYAEIVRRAQAIGSDLVALGVARGDKVALSLANGLELACLYFACWRYGFVSVPINPATPVATMAALVDRSAAKVFVCGETGPTDPQCAPSASVRLFTGAQTPAGFESWKPLDIPATGDALPAFPQPEDPMSLSFTSGTTAVPKGVVHSYAGMISNALSFSELAGLTPDSRFLNVLPMTYMAGFYNLLLLPWLCGGSVVLSGAFGPGTALHFWSMAEKNRVNTLWLVPTIASILAKMNRAGRAAQWCRSHVRACFVGTAPLSSTDRSSFEEIFGVELLENYGLSETLFIAANAPGDNRPGTVGRVLPGVDLRVHGEGGETLPSGTQGDIYLHQGQIMLGYLEGEGVSPPASPFPTGDVGVLEEDGRLAITGRKKDIIIRGGENLSPVAVEEVLLAVEGVRECTVVGLPDEEYGEQVVAVLAVSRPFAEVEAAARAESARELGSNRPEKYYEIDELPRTASGKVNKESVKELLAARLGIKGDRGGGEYLHNQAVLRGRRVVDLSLQLAEGMPRYPSLNHPELQLRQTASIAGQGRQVSSVLLGTHTGTHVDAPSHFLHGAESIESLPPNLFIGPARRIDLTDVRPGCAIGVELLRQRVGDTPMERMILWFGWSSRWGEASYFSDHPFLDVEAARWLAGQGVRLVGVDAPQLDNPNTAYQGGEDSPVHKELLGKGVILLEYLCNLERLRRDTFELVALPLKIKGADGSPVRCVAVEEA